MLYIFTDLRTNMLMYHQTGFLLENVVLENEVIDLGAFGLNEKCWIFIFSLQSGFHSRIIHHARTSW